MGNEDKKKYRLKRIYEAGGASHQTTRLLVDRTSSGDVFMDIDGDPLELSQDQADRVSAFGLLEEVSSDEKPIELVDQPGVNVPSMSTASNPTTGSTPDVAALSSADLKRLAKEVSIEGRTGMTDADLRTALADHYATKEV